MRGVIHHVFFAQDVVQLSGLLRCYSVTGCRYLTMYEGPTQAACYSVTGCR